MDAFINFVKLAVALHMGSFLGALTELQSHPDELIVCISYAGKEREQDEYSEQWGTVIESQSY